MKTENAVLMQRARESLKGRWGLAVGTLALYLVISIAINMIPRAGGLISFLITGPFTLGLTIFSLAFSRNQNAHVDQLFKGFNRFADSFIAYFLIGIFVLLWALLLIVPGIIAAISYSMVFFIMADNVNMSPRDAIKASKKMMDGNKWKYVKLQLRFLGWILLCIPTLGIGFLWLWPYMQIANTKFYEDIKDGNNTEPPVANPEPIVVA